MVHKNAAIFYLLLFIDIPTLCFFKAKNTIVIDIW
jgi:hypothetical protein